MAWLPDFGDPVLLTCAGVLFASTSLLVSALVQRRRRARRVALRNAKPRGRAPARSRAIVLPSDRIAMLTALEGAQDAEQPATQVTVNEALPAGVAPSVHEAPTREFAAYVEELATRSMQPTEMEKLAVHQAPTREFAVAQEPSPASSGCHPRVGVEHEEGAAATVEQGRRPRSS